MMIKWKNGDNFPWKFNGDLKNGGVQHGLTGKTLESVAQELGTFLGFTLCLAMIEMMINMASHGILISEMIRSTCTKHLTWDGGVEPKKLQNDVFHMPPSPLFMSSLATVHVVLLG
jgi:hypothetical protein